MIPTQYPAAPGTKGGHRQETNRLTTFPSTDFIRKALTIAVATLTTTSSLSAADEAPRQATVGPRQATVGPRQAIVGDAILGNQGYELLREMTTRFQGRMAGTTGNTLSMDYLEERLNALGIGTHRERYDVPGWRRGHDQVTVLAPSHRALRAAAMGYVDAHDLVEGRLVHLGSTNFDDLDPDTTRGRIALAAPNLRFSHGDYEQLANSFGMVGVLLTNRVDGGQLLARTTSYEGAPAPLPVYSITAEDGQWLQHALDLDSQTRVQLQTTSACVDLTVENLVATLPGSSGEKIVLGAHFDSWDLGQGAMDNGLGIAQLFETARLLQAHSPHNVHTIEIVFFNAEEWGLWGSRDYVQRHDLSPVRTMINLDMVGRPIGLNAMGFDELVAPLATFVQELGSWSLKPQIANKTWLGSDHHPFVLNGVPSITLNAPIGEDEVRYYHDYADTFDKIDAEMLSRASGIVTLLVRELANQSDPELHQYDEEKTAEIFRAAGLETRMRKMGQWPFGDDTDTP